MLTKRVLFALASLTLAALNTSCAEATLEDLVDQLATPGNATAQTQACNYATTPNLNPEIHTAYLFNYEDYKILRISNAGLSCGEILARPQDAKEGCAIPRYTWELDLGLPINVNPVGTTYPLYKVPQAFWGLETGHNYCGGNTIYGVAGQGATLEVKSTAPNCLLAELKGLGEMPVYGNENQVRKINLNGTFPVQLCDVKDPKVSDGFMFELAKAKAGLGAVAPN